MIVDVEKTGFVLLNSACLLAVQQAQTCYISHRHLTVVSMYRLCLPGQVCCSYLLSHSQCTSHSGGIGPGTKWLQLNLSSVTCRLQSTHVLQFKSPTIDHSHAISDQVSTKHWRSSVILSDTLTIPDKRPLYLECCTSAILFYLCSMNVHYHF